MGKYYQVIWRLLHFTVGSTIKQPVQLFFNSTKLFLQVVQPLVENVESRLHLIVARRNLKG